MEKRGAKDIKRGMKSMKNIKNINSELAGIFWEMADIYELKKVQWKPQAYRMAAQTIESLRISIDNIYKKEGEKGLDSIPGVGAGITKKIIQFIETGKIDEHERLKGSIPKGLYDLMNIPGVGVKKATLFYHKLGIKSIDELKRAAISGKLVGLPGFKQRAQEKILEGIGIKAEQKGRIPYKKAKKIADNIANQLKKLPEVQKVLVVGSIRRKKPTIGDIDIVVQTLKPEKVADKYVKMNFVKKVLGKGKKKAVVITKENIQADIRLAKPDEYGACVVYFTGDKQHNIWQRKIAIKKGWKLNEYGLFDRITGKRILNSLTESQLYQKLGIKMPMPEKRIGETE